MGDLGPRRAPRLTCVRNEPRHPRAPAIARLNVAAVEARVCRVERRREVDDGEAVHTCQGEHGRVDLL